MKILCAKIYLLQSKVLWKRVWSLKVSLSIGRNLYRLKSHMNRSTNIRVYKLFIPLLPFFLHPRLSTSFRFRPVGRAWGHASAPADPVERGTLSTTHEGVFSPRTYAIRSTSKNWMVTNNGLNNEMIRSCKLNYYAVRRV